MDDITEQDRSNASTLLAALTALVSIAALTLLVTAPAIVILAWRAVFA
jgi:hypothetical protein